MDKINEDELYVYYKFYTKVQGESYLSKSGNLRYRLETKYGYCKFNKETEEFELDKEKTDPYFTENSHAKILIMGKLMKCNKEKKFPDIIDIATG